MSDARWVIVTGAGASREFGTDSPLPLMRDWCRHLFDALNRRGGIATEVGLAREMEGLDFERTLGGLLQWRRALPVAGTIRTLGSEGLGGQVSSDVETWFRLSEHRGNEAVEVIHESLFELFGQSKIGSVAATGAYRALFQRLGITTGTRLVYATTNYDVAGELALDELGFRPFWGEDAGLRSGSPRVVHTEGLLEAIAARRTPVLHLHGRVGWYFGDDDRVRAIDAHAGYNAGYGTPALLLPDPKKDYEESSFVADLWRQFRSALRDASHVLVIGHSLHDEALVDALREVPKGRLGVSIFGESNHGGLADDDERTVDLYKFLPHAQPVEMRFAYELQINEHLLKKYLDAARAANGDTAT